MDIKVLASGSSGNAYLVDDGYTNILLDCGIPAATIRERCGFTLHEIDSCLVTHAHQDHCKSIGDLAAKSIDIYTAQETIDACHVRGHRLHAIAPLNVFEIGTFKVTPFDVQHDAPMPLGFLLESKPLGERLLYITDTPYLKYKIGKLDYILAECNYDPDSLHAAEDTGRTDYALASRIVKSHMNVDTLVKMLTANDLSKLKQIYLLHMSDANSNAELIRKMVQRATGAEVFIAQDMIGKETGF
jgi:phosphoribosyl 1,2-cyclic phosphodiesterase